MLQFKFQKLKFQLLTSKFITRNYLSLVITSISKGGDVSRSVLCIKERGLSLKTWGVRRKSYYLRFYNFTTKTFSKSKIFNDSTNKFK